VIDFTEIPTTEQRLVVWRWRLVGGVIGESIALATAATVVTNALIKRRPEPHQLLGVRRIRRHGLRDVATPRGGIA
jgi:hypothetical protein